MNRILILGIALGLLASGCGEGGGDAAVESPAPTATAGGGGGTTLEVPAHPEKLAFDVSALEAPVGKVTLVMENPPCCPTTSPSRETASAPRERSS